MKTKKLSKVLLGIGILSTLGIGSTVHAADPIKGEQKVSGTIVGGSLIGGINQNPGTSGLEAKDISFSTMTIGKPIQPIRVENLVTVKDQTGGKGWKATAKLKRTETTNYSVFVSITMDGQSKKYINESEQTIAEGPSSLSQQTFAGSYGADWTENAKAGQFEQVIEWTFSPKV